MPTTPVSSGENTSGLAARAESRSHPFSSHSTLMDVHYPLPPATFSVERDPRFYALSDIGRRLGLFHFEAYIFPAKGEQLTFHPDRDGSLFLRMAEHNFLLNTKQNCSSLQRMGEPSTECNCHGWVFGGGRFVVEPDDVPMLLADNGYRRVSLPQDGDAAIYFQDERITHSGIARTADSGAALIESKWGPFGVFAHKPEALPFPGECRFYRSPRVGHTIKTVACEE